jgi:hypothetical protein
MDIRNQERKYDEVRLISSLILLLLLCRTEEKIQKMHVLHQNNTKLIQKYDEPFANVVRKDFILARRKQFQKWP